MNQTATQGGLAKLWWILTLPAGMALAAVVVMGAAAASATLTPAAGGDITVPGVPDRYVALAVAADHKYLPQSDPPGWAFLLAIAHTESNFSIPPDCPTSSAGARGPMQFMPGTWKMYSNGDICSPEDAVPAAARYLKASGAPDYTKALFAYNHSAAYGATVQALAAHYASVAQESSLPASGPLGSMGRLVQVANWIERQHYPYCWGGGHGSDPAKPSHGSYCWLGLPNPTMNPVDGIGLDCSGAVSMLLQQSGFNVPTLDSTGFMSWGQPGPGKHLTVWANSTHVFTVIDGRTWQTSDSNFNHGPGWTASRSHAGFTPRHLKDF